MKRQVEIPVNDNYITTSRSLDPNHPNNIDILKDTEDEKTYKDLLDEVKIRFDTNPKHYQKEDYKKLLELFRYLGVGIEEEDLKTINGESLVGDGDIEIILETKTINGLSLQGEGNINVSPVLSEGNAISLDNNIVSVTSHTYNSSTKSVAFGNGTTATDLYSHAEGDHSEASGKASHAEGGKTYASGDYSHAEGKNTYADGNASHAEGYYTYTSNKASHAEGYGILFNTGSTGFSWTTEDVSYGNLEIEINAGSSWQYEAPGKTALTLIKELNFIDKYSLYETEIYSRETKESVSFYVAHLTINGDLFDETYTYDPNDINYCSIYLNVDDIDKLGSSGILDVIVPVYADAQSSHAEGKNTQVIGKNAHVEGLVNKAEGENSHVEGHMSYTNGDGYNAHAEGYNTKALKNQAHSEGANTQAYGENSHVEGEETCAWGKDSHAEGKSSNSPAIDDYTYFRKDKDAVYNQWKLILGNTGANEYACAWALASHIEGKDNLAVGNNSHAEGQDSCAYGNKSHAEGSQTVAKGNNSHAEGDRTEATGFDSHAEGLYVTAQNETEHAEGKCNKSHKNSDTYGNAGNTLHSIGIGVDYGGRKNALEIMQNGDMYVFGVGGYQGTDTKVQDATIKTLQEYIASLEARIAALENPQ